MNPRCLKPQRRHAATSSGVPRPERHATQHGLMWAAMCGSAPAHDRAGRDMLVVMPLGQFP